MELRLYRSMLTYAGLTVHTASSGPVAGLDAIYLELDDGVRRAVGEVRINCTYLNGYAPDELLQCVRGAIGAFDWDAPPETLRATVAASDLPAPVRMLFDVALWDLAARRAGLPLAHLLAGEARVLSHVTNQTLFLSGDDAFDRQVADYVARGFRDLKLRVGQDIEADRARHARIRAAYGVAVKLAADANGAWTALVSGGFDVFTSLIAAKLGFDENRANRLIERDGRLTGEVAQPILGREAKAEALVEISARLGLTPADAIAVGDGANDLDMIRLAGSGVALHAKPAVAAAAGMRIDHGDLTALLYLQGYARTEFAA